MSIIENYLKGEKLKNFKEIEQFQKYFDKMAKYMFGNVAIVIGNSDSKQIKYYLEEIEFYYNNDQIKEEEITFITKDKKERKKDKKNFFSCTYKREREAKQLFWHYSGVDICFQSDKTCYGGILIRSMSKCKGDEDNTELIAGPLRCANELVNQSVELKCIPQIKEIKRPNRIINIDDIGSTVRDGIETAERYKDILENINNDNVAKLSNFPFFCYFIKREENEWITKVSGKNVKYSSILKRMNYIIRPIPK